MRVYAESNFVLEMVLEQEQHQACEELVSLASAGSIELVLPAFALLEPYQTIARREDDGKRFRDNLVAHAKQLERTAWIATDVPQLHTAAGLLLHAEQETWKRFVGVRSKLLAVARMVALDSRALQDASALATQFDLELPDAVMLASVLGDANGQPSQSIFINRNTKDFDDKDIKARLKGVGCDLVWKFEDGLARVTSLLVKNPAPRR